MPTSPPHILVVATGFGPLLFGVYLFANVIQRLHVPSQKAVGAAWKQLGQVPLLVCEVDFTEGVIADQEPVNLKEARCRPSASAHICVYNNRRWA
jgi:hypothetical protein